MSERAERPRKDTRKIGVLIVDDHPLMRVGISSIIQTQADMGVVAQVGTVATAVELFRRYSPDVTLMDLRLPDESGLQAIRKLRLISRDARIIVLTTYEGDEDIHQALQAGAMGYIMKGMPHDVLIKAIRCVHGGSRFLPPPVTNALFARTPHSELSGREREVLALLVAGNTNREIADSLRIKEATVKTHVSVILMRLNVTDRTKAVIKALRRGLAHL